MSREHAVLRQISSSILRLVIVTFAICVGVTSASAQNGAPYIYPSKGQTPEQQNKDRYECSQWAISQSGFDPSKPPTTSSNAQQPQGQAVRGAGRGAAAGAIGGAIAGDAGTGAAAGAAIGGAAGGIRRRRAKKEAQQQQAEAQAAAASGQDAYNRAFATCLQGRGYTVN
jgi:OmpA family protein